MNLDKLNLNMRKIIDFNTLIWIVQRQTKKRKKKLKIRILLNKMVKSEGYVVWFAFINK